MDEALFENQKNKMDADSDDKHCDDIFDNTTYKNT